MVPKGVATSTTVHNDMKQYVLYLHQHASAASS